VLTFLFPLKFKFANRLDKTDNLFKMTDYFSNLQDSTATEKYSTDAALRPINYDYWPFTFTRSGRRFHTLNNSNGRSRQTVDHRSR